MKIIHIHRKPRHGFFSIENIYDVIRTEIKKEHEQNIESFELPFTCESNLNKILNIVALFLFRLKTQKAIYHITGDSNYAALALFGEKIIISVHSVTGGRPQMTKLKEFIFKNMYFLIPKKIGVSWTTVSQFTRSELSEYIKLEEGHIKLIYNPLLPVFKFFPSCQKSNKKNILHVGVNERKNLTRLIIAVIPLDIHLTIVGKLEPIHVYLLEKYKISFENIIEADKSTMLELYKKSDIVAMISLNESFGLPIIEAQAVGRAVICSEVTAMPEIGGKGVCIVEPYNSLDIRKGIKRLISNDKYCLDLVKEGFLNIERFDMTEIAEEYYQLYQSMKL